MTDHNGTRAHSPAPQFSPENLKRLMVELAGMDRETEELSAVRNALAFATGKRFDPAMEAAYHQAFFASRTFMLCPDMTMTAPDTLSADFPAVCEPAQPAECGNETIPATNNKLPLASDAPDSIRLLKSNDGRFIVKLHEKDDGTGLTLSVLITPTDNVYRLEFMEPPEPSEPPHHITVQCVPVRGDDMPVRWISKTVCEVLHDYSRPDLADITIDDTGCDSTPRHIRIRFLFPMDIEEIGRRLERRCPHVVKRMNWWYSPQAGLQGQCPIEYLNKRREADLLAFLRAEDESDE
ncbi:hypothetical protein JXA80_01125 [bacterium]|nr:hypothetical protein [candidate division CSSED10-310 bacterium]